MRTSDQIEAEIKELRRVRDAVEAQIRVLVFEYTPADVFNRYDELDRPTLKSIATHAAHWLAGESVSTPSDFWRNEEHPETFDLD